MRNILVTLYFRKPMFTNYMPKVIKNHSEVQQVYVSNNHPAIIPRDIFHRVQGDGTSVCKT